MVVLLLQQTSVTKFTTATAHDRHAPGLCCSTVTSIVVLFIRFIASSFRSDSRLVDRKMHALVCCLRHTDMPPFSDFSEPGAGSRLLWHSLRRPLSCDGPPLRRARGRNETFRMFGGSSGWVLGLKAGFRAVSDSRCFLGVPIG